MMTGHEQFTLIATAIWLSFILLLVISFLVYWHHNR